MKKLLRAVPHLTIILGLMTLTFFCIDRVNRSMAFMTSELSKWVFAVLALLAIVSGVCLIGCEWREDARKDRALRESAEEQAFYAELRAAEAAGSAPDQAGTALEQEPDTKADQLSKIED